MIENKLGRWLSLGALVLFVLGYVVGDLAFSWFFFGLFVIMNLRDLVVLKAYELNQVEARICRNQKVKRRTAG